MAKILIVDDEATVCETIKDILDSDGHECESMHLGADAIQLLGYTIFDIIVLDWMLPDMDGPSVCATFRKAGITAPVLMLTGRKQASEKIVGLDSGADDYLTKPFDGGELRARVRALLRRPRPITPNELTFKNIRISPEQHKTWMDDKEIHLLPKEFAILELLMRHPTIVFSTEQIITRAWGSEAGISAGALRQTMNRLRTKLEGTSADPIKTVHGVGYTLDDSK